MHKLQPASSIRRRTVALAAASLLTAMLPLGQVTHADTTKPVKLLVGFPPGGGTDAIARVLADKMKDSLGQPVVVENKPGAGGQLAAQALKAAPADGTTLFLSHDHTVTILPLVTQNPGFNPATDFVPVAGFATFVNAFAVSGGTPAKNVAEYVAWVKSAGQGKGAVGIPAPASTPEFVVKLMGQKFGLDLLAPPYRGSAPMMADMLGNQIAAGVASVPDFIENHKAGKLRIVAVLGGQRQATLPDVPTFAELGLGGLEDLPYYGLFAPAGTPKAALDRVADALAKAVAEPDVKKRLTDMGLTVDFATSAQLGEREKAYRTSWTKIIQTSGFKPL
jgi:tripartite-type tricarboxylate transporter receptor subunit TctC